MPVKTHTNWTDCTLGDLFERRAERGIDGMATLSVTLNDGLVERSELERKNETNLTPEQHLLVRKGDIAYNMMRMWQGASGLAEVDGITSPAYIVLQPKEGIDSRFAAHWFKSHEMINLFRLYSHGLTKDRLRLYFDDFAQIPVSVPSLPEQRQIAAILSTWDRAIDQTQRLLDASKRRKQGLAQKLLSGVWRFSEFGQSINEPKLPHGWKTLPFSQIANLRNTKTSPMKTSSHRCIELEHIESGTGILLGWADAKKQKSIKNCFCAGDVIFGKLRPYLKKFHRPNFDGVCTSEIWVFFPVDGTCDPAFLYYLVQSNAFIEGTHISSGSKMPRADWSVVSGIQLPLPPLPEQEKIAAALTVTDNEIVTLRKSLEQLQLQKRGLMQKLLTGAVRV